ncbi:PD40 domain-containing protein [Nocardiopsis sp. CNT-189]|uniref:WD40 repeat domain-containing protein n=1 Tax=Nocardiopsis oceanisediminis TaxID=2816862 RepID=UPI003B318641
MSTDMYGVRVLSADPDELRIDFRVFVVYYDTEVRHHMPPPDDPGFFFFLLWEAAKGFSSSGRGGPLAELLDNGAMLDFGRVEQDAHRYVSRVERTADRNHPPTEEQWERLHDFYYERDGGWKDEDLLVSFDYRVHVTDRRWLEPLRAGDAWGTTMFRLNADTWTAEDAPHIPDLSAPAVELEPFASASGDLDHESLTRVEFSDDGRYLAVCSDENRVWVYDTADWSEVAHVHADGGWIVPVLMWVPGRHVLTLKTYPTPEEAEATAQWAFDVDALEVVEAPFQAGHRRSRDGAHRIVSNDAGEGGFDLVVEGKQAPRRISHAGRWDPIQCHAFSADGTRLFLGAQQNLYVVDPATAGVADAVPDASQRLFELASSPDGAYLAVASATRRLYLGLDPDRPHELCVWRMSDKKVIAGRQLDTYVEALAWSPDGRWLAALLEPTGDGFNAGQTRLAVFRMGPTRS